jgi:hypothetical protein
MGHMAIPRRGRISCFCCFDPSPDPKLAFQTPVNADHSESQAQHGITWRPPPFGRAKLFPLNCHGFAASCLASFEISQGRIRFCCQLGALHHPALHGRAPHLPPAQSSPSGMIRASLARELASAQSHIPARAATTAHDAIPFAQLFVRTRWRPRAGSRLECATRHLPTAPSREPVQRPACS